MDWVQKNKIHCKILRDMNVPTDHVVEVRCPVQLQNFNMR
jgi:hypothetical protein